MTSLELETCILSSAKQISLFLSALLRMTPALLQLLCQGQLGYLS
jgi:hypothetical protein